MTLVSPVDTYSPKYQCMLDQLSPAVRLIWDLGVATGYRVSDMLRLRKADIPAGGGAITIRERKTGKSRSVTIDRYLATRLRNAADRAHSPLCFPGRRGDRPLCRDTVSGQLSRAAKAAGYDMPVGIHSARKTYAYDLWERCNDYATVQHDLGHEHLATTLLYLHGAPMAH